MAFFVSVIRLLVIGGIRAGAQRVFQFAIPVILGDLFSRDIEIVILLFTIILYVHPWLPFILSRDQFPGVNSNVFTPSSVPIISSSVFHSIFMG